MRQWLQRAASHIADSDRYRLLPVYAFLLVLMVRVFDLLPATPDFVWYKIYLGFWVWELQVLAERGALILALCLAVVGLFRRPFLAKFFSISSLMLAGNTIWAVEVDWFHPFAIVWKYITFWSFDMPIGYLESKAHPNYISLGSAYLVYAILLCVLAWPFYRRLTIKLTRTLAVATKRMGWQPMNLL